MATQPPFSVRLTKDAQQLVKDLEKVTGLKRSSVVETAIRELAAKHGVKPPLTATPAD